MADSGGILLQKQRGCSTQNLGGYPQTSETHTHTQLISPVLRYSGKVPKQV